MNVLDEILKKLDGMDSRLDSLIEGKTNQTSKIVPLSEFCKDKKITRQTGYRWADRGIIHLEKLGGRLFVKLEGVSSLQKYQRGSTPA